MHDTDTLKRISGPVLSPTILHREVLVKKLNEVLTGESSTAAERAFKAVRYKLIVICAPAGYGKTTLLADFAQHTSLPCCWYFLDSNDVDKTRFLTSLVLSIRHQFPNFGETLDPLLASAIAADVHSPSHSHFEAAIDVLGTAIATEIPERFALFLCNYHEVNSNSSINSLVNQLLQKLPFQCVLVIESRAVPVLDFASLLARDEIVGFDSSLLRFTTPEIRNLARLQGVAPLKEREAEQLTALFGGWIAGILLGTRLNKVLLLHSRNDVYTPTGMPDMLIDRHHLFAYLVKEVFSRNPNIYTFLKETAVLQQMTPELCNALLESADAEHWLHYVEQQGLFVTRTGDGPEVTYTCHPILRELLCDELRRQSPERFIALHERAIEVWEASHEYEKAIYHAFEAKLDDKAAHLILEAYEHIFAQGRIETLSRWIDALPTETTDRYPKLLLIRANVYLSLSEYTYVLPLLDRASEAITTCPSLVYADETPLFQATLSIARSEALFQTGNYEEAQRLCQQVIEHIPADEVSLHAEAHMRLGACFNVQGNYATGIVHLQKALQLWGRNSEQRQTAKLHNTLARTYGMMGNFALAEHHLSRAAKCWNRLQDGWGRVNNLLNMGMITYRQGEITAAETHFQEALTIARGNIHFHRGEAYALVNLGALYQEQGLYDQSLSVTEDALALARKLEDRYLVNFTQCTLAMTYLLMGDAETAMFLVSEVQLDTLSDKSGGDERANRELARGTILLYQHQYEEAFTCLSELESYLRSIGLRWEQLCAMLRLTECQLMQGHTAEALRYIDDIATVIERNDYEHLVQQELRILPTLERAIKAMPELVRLRTLLHAETDEAERLEEPRSLSVTQGDPRGDPPVVTSATPGSPVTKSDPRIASTIVETRQPRIKILALGEPAILIDEKPITRWRMTRAMELLFLLLDSGRPLRKEQIITALWTETDDHTNQTLHSTIHYLRKSLGESAIASQSGTYRLNLASRYGEHVWYDVAIFQDHYTRARQALENKQEKVAQVEMLAMVDLYRGDYVQSFYSDWCTFQRDKLRLAYVEARNQLALMAFRTEQFEESATHWQHMLAIDPCLENAHYGLMRCYIQQRKRSLALRQYQRCVEVLQNELGVEPGSTLQNLYQQIVKSSHNRPT